MVKKIKKELSPYTKASILLIIILIVGIALRWSYIKESAKRSFNFFSNSEQVDSTTAKP